MSLLAAACLLLAAQANDDPIDAFVRQTMEQQHVPGFVVLVKKGDQVLKRKAYGVASVELGVPFAEDTVFETGSIGKTFTALAVLKLVEQGKLDLASTVKTHFPQAPEAWAAITLQQLLTHTSGLPEYVLFDGLRLDQSFERDQWWSIMKDKPLDFVPGTQFQYSNTNFYLLGHVVEHVSKTPFREFVMNEVVKPCGLSEATRYRTDGAIVPKVADGYFNFGNTLTRASLGTDSSGFGAGGMVSTVDDLARFLEAVTDGKVVKTDTLKLMQAPNRTANGRKTMYGQGWFTRQVAGQLMVSHAGNCVGYSAGMAYFPRQDLTVTLGANVYAVSGDNLAIKIAQLVEPSLVPAKPVKRDDSEAEFSAQLVGALKALGGGDTKNALFDEDMKNRLATPRGQMGLPAMRAYAELDGFEFCGTEPDDPDTVYVYRLKKGDKSFVARFTVTKDKKIYTISVSPEL